MKCPRCGLVNPENAQRCDCGYDFEQRRTVEPYLKSSSPKPNRKRFIGSTIALVVGILAALAGLAQAASGKGISTFNAGVVMMLGSLAYRSAKMRKLGIAKTTSGRLVVEWLALAVILAVVLLQKDLFQLMYEDPVPNLIIPLWVLVAYFVVLLFTKPQEQEVAPTSKD